MLRDLAKSDKQHPALFLLALLPYFTPPNSLPQPPHRCCVLTAGAPVSHQWKFPEMSLWPWVIGRRLGVLRHRHTYRHTILSQTIVPSPHTTAVTPTRASEGKIGPAMRVSLSFFFSPKSPEWLAHSNPFISWLHLLVLRVQSVTVT